MRRIVLCSNVAFCNLFIHCKGAPVGRKTCILLNEHLLKKPQNTSPLLSQGGSKLPKSDGPLARSRKLSLKAGCSGHIIGRSPPKERTNALCLQLLLSPRLNVLD